MVKCASKENLVLALGSVADSQDLKGSELDDGSCTESPSKGANEKLAGSEYSPTKSRQGRQYREHDISKTEGGRVQRRGPKILRLVPRDSGRPFRQQGASDNQMNRSSRFRNNLLLMIEDNGDLRDHHMPMTVNDTAKEVKDIQQRQNEPKSTQARTFTQRRKPIVNGAEAARKSATRREGVHPADLREKAETHLELTCPRAWDCSEDLALRLKVIAMEDANSVEEEGHISVALNPKYRPKPAPPRRSVAVEPHLEKLDDFEGMSEQIAWNNDDVVYDVFVKESYEPQHNPSSPLNKTLSEEEASRTGVLIVDDDDEVLWDSLQDDEGSGPEWSSDEDENGAEYAFHDVSIAKTLASRRLLWKRLS